MKTLTDPKMPLGKRLMLIEQTINRKLPVEFNFEDTFYLNTRADHHLICSLCFIVDIK
ncbi:hypothetical protein [Chryseobacterium caseinilyticum]|uniref:Uncharacterized protein n=1 Tax=Chryseobacterium caseinilyticum TaxID=2771428 RepID=A0ABR8ZGY5_9FLAO|nr:hypothetical protein [Chryseobacterium caseinilyticum]MBD8084559.1 hypothetical protein [Chryseobacterium caseinilyticum]